MTWLWAMADARAGWLVVCALGCAVEPDLHVRAEPWPEATALFQRDPAWVGGDGAYSCDLGPDSQGRGRVLWLFGDSLIARTAKRDPADAWFVRNSIAIQTGYNPTTALIAFHWGQTDGHAGSFFAESKKRWFWPGPCARIGGKLYVFGGWLWQAEPGMWGFAGERATVFAIDNPDASPTTWQPRELPLAGDGTAVDLGTAGFVREGWWYAYGRSSDWHDYKVARFSVHDVERDDFLHPQVWTESGWQPWRRDGLPQVEVFALGAPESSVHFEPRLGRYVMGQSEGFGATTLALRTAPSPEGPWSAPQTVLRPPESFTAGNFVYAGKAHPHLQGADLAMTYVPSQFNEVPSVPRKHWYHPHFAKVTWRSP